VEGLPSPLSKQQQKAEAGAKILYRNHACISNVFCVRGTALHCTGQSVAEMEVEVETETVRHMTPPAPTLDGMKL